MNLTDQQINALGYAAHHDDHYTQHLTIEQAIEYGFADNAAQYELDRIEYELAREAKGAERIHNGARLAKIGDGFYGLWEYASLDSGEVYADRLLPAGAAHILATA